MGTGEVSSGIAASTRKWEHIAVTWDSSTGKVTFYVNGLLQAEVTHANAVIPPVDSDYLTVGAWGTLENYFNGMIDEVRVYGKVLSADEILAHFNEGGADVAPPAGVTNLAGSSATNPGGVTLTWTAPGDDGSSGQAAEYDIRYAAAQITETNWDTATQVSGEPKPQTAGSSETFIVPGLSPGSTYYFAIKTRDEVLNESALSNVVSATASSAALPPEFHRILAVFAVRLS
jgi:hypothetical protein